jgi:UbiD family decarboxylase
MLTINDFLDKVKPVIIDGILDEEYEIARTLYRTQGGNPVVMKGKRTKFYIAGNLVSTRQALLKAAFVNNDEELYVKLNSTPLSIQQSFEMHNFSDYYVKTPLKLSELGFCKFYEKDGGWYINSGIIVTKINNSYNASIHRLMLIDDKRMTLRIVPRHLYYAYTRAKEKGEELPITILLGNHPLYLLLASNSPPLGIYEFTYLPIFLNKKAVASNSPLYGNLIPLGSSVVIEARITLDETEEGPYVDALMTYDSKRMQPVIEVDEIWVSMKQPLYLHALLPGGYEHAFLMGTPREASIWYSVSKVVPKVHKVRLTPASGGWLHAIISITKNHDGDGKNAIMAAFAGHPSLKHVVVVDDDIDPDDISQVEWAIATRFQAHRGLVIINEARGSTLDPSSIDGKTSKMGIDATVPVKEREKYRRGVIPGA